MVSAALRAVALLSVLCATQVEAAARERVSLASSRAAVRLQTNPIRRVVTMLQIMQKKVKAEGQKELELYDKYMCYCKKGTGALDESIAEATEKVKQVNSSIAEAEAAKAALENELASAKEAREEAKVALETAKGMREKEAAAFLKESGELKTNVEALKKAVAALEKGMAGAFLQTRAASLLRQLSVSVDMDTAQRDMLSAFLSQGQKTTTGYAPQSGEIVGILKQMTDEFEADLAEVTKAEEESKKNAAELMAAKAKEIEVQTAAIEAKTERLGEDRVTLVQMKEDLDDTSESLAEDKTFLATLTEGCKTKEGEWEERQKVRAEELLAIADTIKILNNDDSLELFKKTLPSPSLLQVQKTGRELRQRALAALQQGGSPRDYRINLIALAIHGKTSGFEKVIKMIDAMVAQLGEEQADDTAKKTFCLDGMDKLEDEVKELDFAIGDLEKVIADHEESIPKVVSEIEALSAGIKALDKSVAEATEQRKEEHKEFVDTMASDTATLEVIGVAKNRLNKFYNPNLYVKPPPVELAGSFAQVRGLAAPPPPPETWGAYAKKGEASAGVIAMLDMLVKDVDKEMTEMKVEEKDAQAEYETMMAESKEKRIADTKSIETKEALKAELEGKLMQAKEEKKAKVDESMATAKSLADLHMDCDWLLQNFDFRVEARAGEVESLKRAKDVLSGADYSLLQRIHEHHHRV